MIEDKFKELQTERLILRKINEEDAEMLFNNIYNNFEWHKFYYQLPFNSFEDYKKVVSKYKDWYANGNHFRWGIVEKTTGEMIGIVQLHTKDNLNNNCKLAYIIEYKYKKKGYAREAVKEVINFAFDILKYHRIEADIVEYNTDSIKLAESLGMCFECTKQESYKLENKYYNQKVYIMLKK